MPNATHPKPVDEVREISAITYGFINIFDNSDAVCLTPAFVESALRRAEFQTDSTEIMLPGSTMLTKASKPE
jgi:hypothetical protein